MFCPLRYKQTRVSIDLGFCFGVCFLSIPIKKNTLVCSKMQLDKLRKSPFHISQMLRGTGTFTYISP